MEYIYLIEYYHNNEKSIVCAYSSRERAEEYIEDYFNINQKPPFVCITPIEFYM